MLQGSAQALVAMFSWFDKTSYTLEGGCQLLICQRQQFNSDKMGSLSRTPYEVALLCGLLMRIDLLPIALASNVGGHPT